MRSRSLLALLLLGALALPAAPVSGQQPDDAAAVISGTSMSEGTPDLELLLGAQARASRLRLLPESGVGLELVLPGRGSGAAPTGPPRPMGLLGPSPVSGIPAVVWDPAQEGKIRLQLFRLQERTWDDLTPWEKVGYVTAQASAAAGVGYLLSRLF